MLPDLTLVAVVANEGSGNHDVGLLSSIVKVDGGEFDVSSLEHTGGDDVGVTILPDGTMTVNTNEYHLGPGEIEVITYSIGGNQTVTIIVSDDSAMTRAFMEDTGNQSVVLHNTSDPIYTGGDIHGISIQHSATSTTWTVDTNAYELEPGEKMAITYWFECDTHNGTVPQALVMIIVGVNDAPVIVSSLESVLTKGTGDQIVDLLSGASDVDGGTLSVSGLNFAGGNNSVGADIAPNGTMIVDTNVIEVDPGENITVLLAFMVDDGQGGSVPQMMTLTVVNSEEGGPQMTCTESESIGSSMHGVIVKFSYEVMMASPFESSAAVVESLEAEVAEAVAARFLACREGSEGATSTSLQAVEPNPPDAISTRDDCICTVDNGDGTCSVVHGGITVYPDPLDNMDEAEVMTVVNTTLVFANATLCTVSYDLPTQAPTHESEKVIRWVQCSPFHFSHCPKH